MLHSLCGLASTAKGLALVSAFFNRGMTRRNGIRGEAGANVWFEICAALLQNGSFRPSCGTGIHLIP